MAIHPSMPARAPAVDIEAWTVDAARELEHLTISSPAPASIAAPFVRGTSVTIDIPLDDAASPPRNRAVTAGEAVRSGYVRRREPVRRDSLKRRETLLMGREGSRRRQRWENDRLLSNPWAQPPLPMDWEARPTYPVRTVPYYLAPLWDAGLKEHVEKKRKRATSAASKDKQDGAEGAASARVPKEVREKLKRARGAKGLLQALEEEVRKFVQSWEEKERVAQEKRKADELPDPDSEDEEIVFVGRRGQMSDEARLEELAPNKLVFDSLADDNGAAFGRWLVHSIGTYYGLRTWSVTVGDPARREAYVGIHDTKCKKTDRHDLAVRSPLPRPLWCMV